MRAGEGSTEPSGCTVAFPTTPPSALIPPTERISSIVAGSATCLDPAGFIPSAGSVRNNTTGAFAAVVSSQDTSPGTLVSAARTTNGPRSLMWSRIAVADPRKSFPPTTASPAARKGSANSGSPTRPTAVGVGEVGRGVFTGVLCLCPPIGSTSAVDDHRRHDSRDTITPTSNTPTGPRTRPAHPECSGAARARARR